VASLEITLGSPSCSQVRISLGISRKTAAMPYTHYRLLARNHMKIPCALIVHQLKKCIYPRHVPSPSDYFVKAKQ
jgi:hypothetical protein